MKIEIDNITDFNTLVSIKENWNFVYTADPQAQFFLSWEWLSGWLQMVSEPWFILAARPSNHNASYVAFFPLKITVQHQPGGAFYNVLTMAGNSMADYTGLICLPNHEEEVIPAFAAYIQHQIGWFSFNLQNILETDTRIGLLLKYFSRDRFEFSQIRVWNQQDATDHYIAPYISLVDDWDSYLQTNVSSNTRQKIKRFLRKIESSEQFHITHVNQENLESHTEILLRFWQIKWKAKKGETCDVIMSCVRAILRHCFEQNCLYFPVLWQGERPLGAIANFVDIRQKAILFFITGRDETVRDLPPGLILHAHAIRYAIENGFKIYDFLRGNESYKYFFGVKERQIKHTVVKYKNPSNEQLDTRVLALVLKQTIDLHQTNQLADAERGYGQILDIEPNHPAALFGLGSLMNQKGEYQIAENLFKHLLALQPNSAKAWFSLGNSYQAQERLPEAVVAYRQSIALQPAPAVYNNLGYALQQQQNWEEAMACYQKALQLQPDCIEAEVNLANALYAQGKLTLEKIKHYADLNNNLGSRCRQAGDLKTATAYYRQAISMNPNLAEACSNLAQMLQEQAT